MNKSLIISTIGGLLILLAIAMLLPLAVALYYGDGGDIRAFLYSVVITVAIGSTMKFFFQPVTTELRIREGFVTVVFGWIICVSFITLPYLISGSLETISDACFEAMSGLTTTGATVIEDIESLPRGIIFWRSMTQWLGGLGIVVFFIAFLPTTGLGAHHLFKMEIPGGPLADKLHPRIAETAKLLFVIYITLSLLEFLLLCLGNMPIYDAACHTFSNISTGGFSPKNASIGTYHSSYIESVVIAFMFLGACNFIIYYQLARGHVRRVHKNVELRFFVFMLIVSITLVTAYLYASGTLGDNSFKGTLRAAAFQTISITTGTGFTTENFDAWPNFCRFLLLLMMFFGGCAGSTTGAMKHIRILLLLKSTAREFVRLTTPRVIKHVKVYGTSVDEEIITNTYGFFVLYMGLFGAFSLILASMGTDLVTAISAVAATLGNVGPGLGQVGATMNYGGLDSMEKWVLIFCMLLGRLEIYSVILMFMLWRR
ncbi:MAG: TrkH family potassium uptake protein [Candidatus Brocadiales bacterium]